MNLNIENQKLNINFSFAEWLVCFKKKISIPLNHIEEISFHKPRHGRTSIALTFFSNQSNPPTHLIKMGNRYTPYGPEFWYVYGDPESKFLCLKLKGDSYKKIVLEFDGSTSFDELIPELDATTKIVK